MVARLHGGDGGLETLDRLAEVSPDLARFVVQFAYGDIYTRPGIEQRARHIATVSSLVTLGGCEPQLEVHVGSALDGGMAALEVVETVLHLVPYVGFPRALNAIAVIRRVLERRGISPAGSPTDPPTTPPAPAP